MSIIFAVTDPRPVAPHSVLTQVVPVDTSRASRAALLAPPPTAKEKKKIFLCSPSLRTPNLKAVTFFRKVPYSEVMISLAQYRCVERLVRAWRKDIFGGTLRHTGAKNTFGTLGCTSGKKTFLENWGDADAEVGTQRCKGGKYN